MIYLCTPFSIAAADRLQKMNVSAFKIGSGEMTDIPTLSEIAKFNLPMIVSTGMSQPSEIRKTYLEILKINKRLVLMNCTSEYPPIFDDINLGYITKMKKNFPKAWVGHSDHTSGLITSLGAVSLGAKVIEKHVTLNKNDVGPDREVSIDFSELKILVEDIKNLFKSLGDKKQVNSKERPIRKWAFRSIVSVCEIEKNQIISKKMIWSKRPGTGIPAKNMNKVIGKKAKKKILANTLLKWTDFY